jgi:hypothetical protein
MHSTQEKKLKALGSELTKGIKTGEDLSSLPRSPNKGFPYDESTLRWFISRRRQAIKKLTMPIREWRQAINRLPSSSKATGYIIYKNRQYTICFTVSKIIELS